ncbi:uncharacterized protein LOC128234424 [Mya arenaria]|uniref:uncharacterized protein LOC128234424 n=1 Tax=Mya arenaria TaxID=6604 RepID=UPI0022E8F82B|nr:uncharacterized protein LOC128234424 [Mya arenaria]
MEIYSVFGIVFGLCVIQAVQSQLVAEKGETVIIKCPIPGVYTFPEWAGPPLLATPLTTDDVVNELGIEFTGDRNLNISSAHTKHSGEYTCKVNGSEATVNLTVNWYTAIVSFEKVEKAMYKENYTATCIVHAGFPVPDVYFLFPLMDDKGDNVTNNSEITKTVSLTQENTVIVNTSITYNIKSIVGYNRITCVANYTDANVTVSYTAYITVQFPPLVRSLGNNNPVVGKPGIFNCVTQSYPGSTLRWVWGDTDINQSGYNISINGTSCQQEILDNYQEQFVCVSVLYIYDLEKGARKNLTCEAQYQGQSHNQSTLVEALFPPTYVSIDDPPPVKIGRNGTGTVTLTCAVDEAKPTSDFRWYRDRVYYMKEFILNSTYPVEEYPGNYSAMKVTQEIDVNVTRAMNGTMIFCCARQVHTPFMQTPCDNVTLEVQYPPMFLAPTENQFYFAVGQPATVQCAVDSHPGSNLQWRMVKAGAVYENVTDIVQGNYNQLNISTVSVNSSGMYACFAWAQDEDINEAINQTIRVDITEQTFNPVISVSENANGHAVVTFTVAQTEPPTFRHFYIMYRGMSTNVWVQIDQPIASFMDGTEPSVYTYTMPNYLLTDGTNYEFAIKSVNSRGLEIISRAEATNGNWFFRDKDASKNKADTVSTEEYRNAIIISVFVTAGCFLIIIIILVCAVKRGLCEGSSSSKSYAM